MLRSQVLFSFLSFYLLSRPLIKDKYKRKLGLDNVKRKRKEEELGPSHPSSGSPPSITFLVHSY
jgi:hypothetical protein